MIKNILPYLVLPKEQSDFEDQYLARMNRVGLWFFVAHVPLFVLIAAINGTGPLLAAALTSAVLVGPLVASRFLNSRRAVSTVMGVTAMLMGGLLVHFGQGPVQIEMHFYFFVLLALLAVFANPMVVIAAAITAALHHAVLWLVLPSSVFNYDAPIWVVGVHAAFVVLESVAACFIARSFFDNVVQLEKKVAQRTAELESRNNDMRMLLDAVNQGFLTIDRDLVMSEERSAAIDKWLGTPEAGQTLPDFLRQHDTKFADWLALGLGDVFDSIMPVEVTIDQLPSRFTVGSQTMSVQYTPVEVEGEVTALAVVISDISADVEREKLEAENREMMAMVERISEDKQGFLEFFSEADGIIKALREESRDDVALVKRRVHTLKGNCSIFGLARVAHACHEIEDHIAETNTLPESAAWTRMFGCWASVRGYLRRLIGDETSGIAITDSEYRDILAAILRNDSTDDIATRIASWSLEPTRMRMSRIAEQARGLCRRLGKGEIDVQIQGGHLRTDAKHWAEFWSSFIHIVRNAVDHGLESAEDRQLAGKPQNGRLSLATELQDEQYVVSLSDDGRGINWERVAELARERELPFETRADLLDALFADGLSTAEVVTDTSGRGVGMGAVRDACLALGGKIEVDSSMNEGTTFRFVFPVSQMAPATVSMLGEHGIERAERTLIGTPESAGT